MSGRINLKSVRLKTAQKYSNWLLFYLFFQKQAPFSVPSINGKYTETIFTMNEPLKAGRIKIIKTILKEDGSLATSSTAVGVSVKLDWKPGGSHDVDI